MFCEPSIIIYLCSKDQQNALFTFSFIPINNLYMFRTGLLLIVRRYCSVYTAVCLHHRLLCGTGSYTPNVLQPTEAYCTNPTLVSPPSSPETFHIRQHERPLLARGGTMGDKCPIKFSLQIRLPQ
jgi:hypothetical protein